MARRRLAQDAVSLLRIHGSLGDPPLRCEWALLEDGREPVPGEGRLAELPRRAGRMQLVLPAAQVLITRARVPRQARRRAGSVLAFAVEDQTAGEPDAN
jgi:general secretion pathway protein L